jgi:hypothetical protein
MAGVLGRVFIYGGRGALGAACVAHFKAQNWVRMKYRFFMKWLLQKHNFMYATEKYRNMTSESLWD